MHRANLKPLWIPKTGSEFNVVEIYWSWFKRRWRAVVSDPSIELNLVNTESHVIKALEESQHSVPSIVKGPLKFIRKHPPESLPSEA